METKNVIDTAQAIVQNAVAEMLTPRAGECLGCYVARHLDEFGCNGTHRFATMFRDRAAPRATALLTRLSRMGACCCDCEVFKNAYVLRRQFITPGFWFTDARGRTLWQEPTWPEQLPPCRQVRRSSTQPCEVWERRYRGDGYW